MNNQGFTGTRYIAPVLTESQAVMILNAMACMDKTLLNGNQIKMYEKAQSEINRLLVSSKER